MLAAPKRPKRVEGADFARRKFMLLLILEAFAVLLLFVFIIWWTMFSGRERGELPSSASTPSTTPPEEPQP